MKGYIGKILKINLSAKTFESINIEDEIYEKYLSGAGLGAWYIYKNIPAGCDPLGEENVLGFTSGLLTGTGSVLTGRFMVVTKSPLTGGIGESNSGGYFSPAIKQCGYDAIFFHGRSEKLSYIFVGNKGVEFFDCEELKGIDATETEELLLKKHTASGKIPAIATIGISGENLSLISGICTDKGRIAARGGIGAVMGSKNLKAIVLCGSKPIKAENPEEIKKISKNLAKKLKLLRMPFFIKPNMLGLMKFMPPFVFPLPGLLYSMIQKAWGTAGLSAMSIVTGDTPIKNWKGSVKDYPKKSYKKMDALDIKKREFRKYHCYSCILGCGGECEMSDLDKLYKITHKPEYETQMAFGGLLLNQDLDSLFLINEILNRAGMDTISAGHCVSMAIECYEKGKINIDDLGGIDIGWGKTKEIVEFVRLMVERKGIGNIFADGTNVAAKKLGKGAMEFAVQAGGQECGMHDGRGDAPLALAYATDATPGRHTIGSSQYYQIMHLWKRISWAPKLRIISKKKEYEISDAETIKSVAMSYYKKLIDGTGSCFFGALMGVENFQIFEWLNYATGWNKTPDEYMVIGKRINTLRQMFNIKQGINPWDFRLHKRLAGEPALEQGPLKGKTIKINEMMKDFWDKCGWDRESGIPLEKTIKELGLIDIDQKEKADEKQEKTIL